MDTITRIRFEKRSQAYDAPWGSGVGVYWRSPGTATAAVRQRLRALDLGAFKTADDATGSPESSFEQAFSSLGYAYIKDKVPRLLDYMIGFQLVDRNEDNTKAMGVFGCKVGKLWLYLPVFFLNGDLKGHELCWIKNQSSFVPNKENWINHLISRRPHGLGEPSEQNTAQLGGVPPDLHRMSRPPTGSKYGADQGAPPRIQTWALPFLPFCGAVDAAFARTLYKTAAPKALLQMDKVAASPLAAALAETAPALDLRAFLTQDISLLKGAYDLACAYPLIKKGFDRFYGPDFFKQAALSIRKSVDDLLLARPPVKRAAAPRIDASPDLITIPEHPHPLKTGALQVILRDAVLSTSTPFGDELLDPKMAAETTVDEDAPGGIKVDKDLDDSERERLMRDGVVVRDTRDLQDVSLVYNTQVRTTLQNPTETGLYEVLEKPGTFDRMLVVHNPQTNDSGRDFVTVVRLGAPKNWLNAHSTVVWTKADQAPDKTEFNKWFEGLSSADMSVGGYYLLVGPNGAGTTPFRVSEKLDEDNYRVDFKCHTDYRHDRDDTWPTVDTPTSWRHYHSTYDALINWNRRVGSRLRQINGELMVPDGFKAMKLKDPPKPKNDDDDLVHACLCHGFDEAGSDPKQPIMPGNLADVQMLFYGKTASLRMFDLGGGEVQIKSPKGEQRLQKMAALVSLVRDHGFTEFAARTLLTETARIKSAAWRIKYAGPFGGGLQPGPSSPSFPEPWTGMETAGPNAYPSIYPQETEQVVPELMGSNTDLSIYDPFYQPDTHAMQIAQQSSQSGDKEVFDVGMLGGMLKSVRQDSLVDRYLSPLMKALNALGSILFMFYWHQEDFEDRYSRGDLPELEDSLTNAFESLGDVTLFLKEKTVGDLTEMQGVGKQEPSIDEVARN